MPSIASAIEPVWRTRPGSAPETWDDAYIGDYRLKGDLDAEAAREALALLELLDQRSERRECAKALGRLKSVTVSRAATAEDLALQIDTMASELTEYPIDVAREACRRSARVNRFFPTWAELRELCEDVVVFRRALARELKRHLDGLDPRAAAESDGPACSVWNAKAPALRAELGEAAWNAWLSQVTPYEDDGMTLILAVPSRFMGHRIRGNYGPVLERILERKVMFIVKPCAGPAARERRSHQDSEAVT